MPSRFKQRNTLPKVCGTHQNLSLYAAESQQTDWRPRRRWARTRVLMHSPRADGANGVCVCVRARVRACARVCVRGRDKAVFQIASQSLEAPEMQACVVFFSRILHGTRDQPHMSLGVILPDVIWHARSERPSCACAHLPVTYPLQTCQCGGPPAEQRPALCQCLLHYFERQFKLLQTDNIGGSKHVLLVPRIGQYATGSAAVSPAGPVQFIWKSGKIESPWIFFPRRVFFQVPVPHGSTSNLVPLSSRLA
jgi:hypothetical protein